MNRDTSVANNLLHPVSKDKTINNKKSKRMKISSIDLRDDALAKALKYYDYETISDVETLVISDGAFEDTSAISHFTKLQNLDIHGGNFSEIDLSQNTALRSISIVGSVLEKITLNCPWLEELVLSDTKLTDLDLSSCESLEEVRVQENELRSITVKAPSLRYLEAGNNEIENIDLSSLSGLECLMLSENKLKQIDLSKNEALTDVELSDNRLEVLTLNAPELTTLSVNDNRLKSLTIEGDCEEFTALEASDNQLTSLDLSPFLELSEVDLESNNLEQLILSNEQDLDVDIDDESVIRYID